MGMYEVNRFARMLKSEDRLYARLSCVSEIGAARRRGLSPSRKPRSGVVGVQPRRREGAERPSRTPGGRGRLPVTRAVDSHILPRPGRAPGGRAPQF